MKEEKKIGIALGVLVVALIGTLSWQFSGERSEQLVKEEQIEQQESKRQVSSQKRADQRARLAEVTYTPQEEKLGIKKGYVGDTSAGIPLRFSITTEPRCMLGDMDTIKKDLENSPNPRLLVSIESLNPNDTEMKPLVREVNPAFLRNGYSMTFMIPKSIEPRHLGIFLCSDADEQGRCLDAKKRVEDLNKVYYEYLQLETTKRQQAMRKEKVSSQIIEAEDRVYFFNYLLVSDSVVSVLDNQMPETAYRDLEEHLSQSVSLIRAREMSEQIKTLNTTLKSISIDVENRKLKLNFPYLEVRECDIAKQAMEKVAESRKQQSNLDINDKAETNEQEG